MIKKVFTHAVFAFLLVSTALLVPNRLQAQLVMTPGSSLNNWTPDSLVRNVLLGEGVEILNVKFNGSLTSINCNGVGKFTTGTTATNLGIESGIVLSASALDYINTANSYNTTSNCPTYSDNNLSALVGTYATNNVAVLEFDFIPKSDSVKFRYVFASEEYYGFECSEFNDVFAFFLSGVDPNPGNPTGMYENKNIALIPNSETPITINTVNGGQSYGTVTPCILTNTQYFVNNTAQTYVKHMDGFTTVLTAEANVVPCQTYHLKMAVCNVSDQSLPSCVFLEANSLSSNAIQFSFDNQANPQNPENLYEGCVARIKMRRPNLSNRPTTIGVSFEGEVTNGVDFPIMNPTFTFPANTEEMSITIAPDMDGVDEGTDGREYAKFVLSPSNGCPRSDSVEFYIVDTRPIEIHALHDSISSSTFQLIVWDSIVGGMPNRTVTWTNLNTGSTATGDTLRVHPLPDSVTFMVMVEDACLNVAYDTITVGVRRNFAFPPHDTIICEGEALDFTVVGADSCVWSANGEAPFEMESPTVHLEPTGMVVYYIKSYIWWNGQIWEDIDSIRVVVIPKPEVSLTASAERICEGQSTTLTASGTQSYSWDGGETFSATNTFNLVPDSTIDFVVLGLTSGADCYGRDTIHIQVDTVPDIVIQGGGGVCDGEDVEIDVTTSAEFFMWVANPNDPTLSGQEQNTHILVNPLETTTYTVNATNGVCNNSRSTTVAVELSPVAIGEVSPKTVSLGSMEAVFTDLSEHATTRKWEFPDGTIKEDRQVTYVVPNDVDSVNIILWAYNPYMCFDTTTITVYVDHTTLWVPNAFTPEESTNSTFEVKLNDVQRYHILIYDRRGQLVFESFDPEKPWDGNAQNGKNCPQGVYSYIISCHKITYPYDQIVQKGTVVLIR